MGRPKISLDKPGVLLVCTHPAKFWAADNKITKGKKPQKIMVNPGEVVLYLGCWTFSEPLGLTEHNRQLYHDMAFRNNWMHPRDVAMLNFLYGEQILRIKFAGTSAQLKEVRKQTVRESSLFTASFWLYTHFEVATPKGEEM